jgi:hypothetical protein
MREITLRLNEDVARILLEVLDGLGEHWAAGAPIPHPPRRVHQQLGVVTTQLHAQLGIPTIAEAMASTTAELRQLAGVGADEPVSTRLGERAPAKVPAYVLTGLEAIRTTTCRTGKGRWPGWRVQPGVRRRVTSTARPGVPPIRPGERERRRKTTPCLPQMPGAS